MKADLLLTHARVRTVDGDTVAPAVAIWRDRIVALEDVPADRTIDLDGAVVPCDRARGGPATHDVRQGSADSIPPSRVARDRSGWSRQPDGGGPLA